MRAPEWNSQLALWESAYKLGTERGLVTPHTLQNYATSLAWVGEYERAVEVFEMFEAKPKDELGGTVRTQHAVKLCTFI